jgi:hypothetical protein
MRSPVSRKRKANAKRSKAGALIGFLDQYQSRGFGHSELTFIGILESQFRSVGVIET